MQRAVCAWRPKIRHAVSAILFSVSLNRLLDTMSSWMVRCFQPPASDIVSLFGAEQMAESFCRKHLVSAVEYEDLWASNWEKKSSNIYRMDEWWVGVTIKHGNAEGSLISQLQLSFNVVLLLENHSEPRKYPRRDVKRNWSDRSVRGAAAIIYRAWRSLLFLSQLNPGRS